MPIRTPSGRPLRYEAYYRSSFISARGRRIFRQFAPVMLGALSLLALTQLPLAWQLARRVGKSQDERERLLKSAIEASDVERRRIARDLHDGVVQDLAGVSYSLSAAAEGAPAPFDAELREAAAETRQGIRQLRTPPRRDLSARAPPRRPSSGACRPAHGLRSARDGDRPRRRSRSRADARGGSVFLPSGARSSPQRNQARRRDAGRNERRAEEWAGPTCRRGQRPRLRPQALGRRSRSV